MARIWFGDWHVTLFGIVLSFVMTIVHYYFELAWNLYQSWFDDLGSECDQKDWFK